MEWSGKSTIDHFRRGFPPKAMVVFRGANSHQTNRLETSILLSSALQAPAGSLAFKAELTNDTTKDGEIVVLRGSLLRFGTSCGRETPSSENFHETELNWLVVGPPLWKIGKSIGMMKFPIYGKIKNVPNHQPVNVGLDIQMPRVAKSLLAAYI